PRLLRIPLRLLQPPGARGGAGDRVRPGARRRQRPRPARAGAVRAAARDGAPEHHHRRVRAAGAGARDRAHLRPGPRADQGLRRGPPGPAGAPGGGAGPELSAGSGRTGGLSRVPGKPGARGARVPDHGGMSAHPHDALPIRLTVDDSDSPADVVDALFLGRFATGEQPYSHSVNIDRVRSGATLLPPSARVLRVARDDDRSATLAEGDGWTVLVSRWNRGADVTVTATSAELAAKVLDE